VFGQKIELAKQSIGGSKLGTPSAKSTMVLDDHAGPVIRGGGIADSHELGLMEMKIYSGAVAAALMANPSLPTR
jgi:uncharacterized protein related to proFAR isomerase